MSKGLIDRMKAYANADPNRITTVYPSDVLEAIAAARAEQREEDAKIADHEADDIMCLDEVRISGSSAIARRIAAAIRNGASAADEGEAQT